MLCLVCLFWSFVCAFVGEERRKGNNNNTKSVCGNSEEMGRQWQRTIEQRKEIFLQCEREWMDGWIRSRVVFRNCCSEGNWVRRKKGGKNMSEDC